MAHISSSIFYLFILLSLGISLLFNGYMTTKYMNAIENECSYCKNLELHGERMGLYDPENEYKAKTEGVYFDGKKYTCIWLGNDSIASHYSTVCHETMHFLLDDGIRGNKSEEWDHFCNRR